MDALDRAKEIFDKLKMYQTAERNAVLIYVAFQHHQLAIYGDEGIYRKVGKEYWDRLVHQMIYHFHGNSFADGIRFTVIELGQDLQKYFPYHKFNDKNELPDNIEFGR